MMDFFRVVLIILLAIPVGVLGRYLLEKIVDDALESKKKDGKK